MTAKKPLELSYGEQKIQIEDELLCLTDFWKAVGRPRNKSAPQWLRRPQTIDLIMRLEAKLRRSGALVENRQTDGTFAHWQIALAYAKFLSPDLEMHINQVYMRYQAGDVTLADQIADKAGPQGQQWLLGRIVKKLKGWLKIEQLPETENVVKE